jgi:hypothetical protein
LSNSSAPPRSWSGGACGASYAVVSARAGGEEGKRWSTHHHRTVLVVQREERVHIRQALAQLAVDRAKEVEREAELEHELVRHHEVTDAHLPSYDPLRGE